MYVQLVKTLFGIVRQKKLQIKAVTTLGAILLAALDQ